MKGAHSIKQAKEGGGRVSLVVTLLCALLLIALVGALVSGIVNGRLGDESSSPGTQDEQVAGGGASEEAGDQPGDESTEDEEEAAPEPTLYVNSRFGFEVELPVGFDKVFEAKSGESVEFVDEDLSMMVIVTGYNNNGLDSEAVKSLIWNESEDSIARAEDNRVIIFQYDEAYEYFYWIYIGPGSINQMEIRYPTQSDTAEELEVAQAIMKSFVAGDLSVTH